VVVAAEEEVDQLLTMAKHAEHILAGDSLWLQAWISVNRMILQQKS
jgi:hypothetical protein